MRQFISVVVLLTLAIACSNSVDGSADNDVIVTDDDSQTTTDDGDVIILGTAELTWTAPTTTVAGEILTNLAGYRVYYGTSPGGYTETIDVGNVTTTTITDLSPGTYYFAVTAYDSDGGESALSGEVSKIIP